MRTQLAIGALGVLLMGYALYGVFTDPGTDPLGQGEFLAGVLVVHDFVLLPLGLAVGALVARRLSPRYRRIIHSGLWASAVVALVSLPFIAGPGHISPRNYPAGLLITLAAVWLIAGIAVLVRRRKA